MKHLEVIVVNCRNLIVKDVLKQSSDPYVKLRIGERGEFKKTEIIHTNLNPDFDETIVLDVEDPDKDNLQIEVWDKDYFSPDDFMGKCEVVIGHLVQGKPTKLTIALKDVKHGEISLILIAKDFGTKH